MKSTSVKKILQLVVAISCCVCLPVLAGGKSFGSRNISTHFDKHKELANENGPPVVSVGAPNAFGPTGTVLFLTGTYVDHWLNTSESDGLMGLGASMGNPHKYVGVMVNVAFANLGANNASFGENGTVGLRLNRYLTPNTAIAFGAATVAGWGNSRNISNSFYGALTHSFHVLLPMAINVGIGTGGFNKSFEVPLAKDENVNAFVGYGVELFKGLSVAFDCVAKQVNVGVTYAHVFGDSVPFFVSVAGRNLNTHDSQRKYLQVTAGLAYIIS